jgi:hypothetical protein
MFAECPEDRAESVPDAEILAARDALGVDFPQDYIDFVRRYGAGMVGPSPILGLRRADAMSVDEWSLIDVNREFRASNWPGVDEWLIVSVDLGGNPVGISKDGRVWVSDHGFRQILCIADSFEDFLREECLDLDL